MVFIYPKSV